MPLAIRAGGCKVWKDTTPEERIEAFNTIRKDQQMGKIDGITIDLFSASAVSKVYEACNADNRKKLDAMPIQRLVRICYQMIGSK